jgi:adenosylcobyric acid synthase
VTALMVQGVSSWAGKSLLTTAIARMCARAGLSVAPFKAQNMSNNARVVDGGEIGSAQYFQALAACVRPDVRMNPVLVKPEGDRRSQVVINGKPDLALSALDWRERPPMLWPAIERAYRSLAVDYDLILIEGAGSPAEINLRETDLANMRMAELADASVLLVADVNRGGAFAHLYGTWALLRERERARLHGFVLNKFRGDAGLLSPGPERLEQLTGIPTLAVVPWLEHRLPDEDGVAESAPSGGRLPVAIVRYPTASNLDEFKPLEDVVDVSWIRTAETLDPAAVIVLPGSKNVGRDLVWLRETGIAGRLGQLVAAGRRVLAVCGGLQMLGRTLVGHPGVDCGGAGLGLLPIDTTFGAEKLTREVAAELTGLPAPWSALDGVRVRGYEIRHGELDGDRAADVSGRRLAFAAGSVLGLSFHGAFENDAFLRAFCGASSGSLEDAIARLTDQVEWHLPLERVLAGVVV